MSPETKTVRHLSERTKLLNQLWKDLGGMDGVKAFLSNRGTRKDPSLERKKSVIAKTNRWTNIDGRICFSVTTTERTDGQECLNTLRVKEIGVTDYAKRLLLSDGFSSCVPGECKIMILRGGSFSDRDRTNKALHAEASKLYLRLPPAEIAIKSILRFSPADFKAMGFKWIAIMHNPLSIPGPGYGSSLLRIMLEDGSLELGACPSGGDARVWANDGGFAFETP